MREPFFKHIELVLARILLVAGLALTLLDPRASASEVVAFGYNMGVPPVVTNAIAVGVRGYSLVALRADGLVAQWGNSASDPGVSNVVSFASGTSHAFGFRADGTLIGWGDDSGGGISEKPVNLTNALAVGVGAYATLAVLEDGTVTSWGDDSAYMLNVPEGLSNVTALSVGMSGYNVLALRADGTVLEWGYNELTSELYTNTHPELSNVVAVAAANDFRSAVLHFDGHVTAWPNNAPDNVPPADLTNIVTIAGGGDHLLALRNNGTVIPWGCECRSDFVATAALTNVTAMAAGGGDSYDYSIFLIGHSNPPPVLSISHSNITVRLTLVGQAFRRYVIEQSAGSSPQPAWAFKQNLTLPRSAQATLDISPTGDVRFYRARLLP